MALKRFRLGRGWGRTEPAGSVSGGPAVPGGPGVDRRGLARTGTIGAAVLLVGALTVIVNYFGAKYWERFDWTAEQLYTLSEKTVNLLAEVDRDVEVYVFLDPSDELYTPVRELLQRYEAASPRIDVRLLDPGRDVLEARRLAEEYELTDAAVVFDAGDDQRVVQRPDLVEYDFTGAQFGMQPEIEGFHGEQRFSQAILSLVEETKPRVLFTTGHGERSLDDRGPGGLAAAARILGQDNFEIEEWASLGADEVPEGTDLIVVAGPRTTFLPPELALFSGFLESGGRMLFLLDAAIGGAGGPAAESGLVDWLAGWGVEVGRDVVVDPENQLPTVGAGTFFVNRWPAESPPTRSVRQAGVPMLVSIARSVGGGSAPDGAEVAVLVESSPEAWAERDLASADVARDPEDLGGPLPLGVVVRTRQDGAELEDPFFEEDADLETGAAGDDAGGPSGPEGFRLVVFGDSDWATAQLLEFHSPNAVLLADTLNWLVEREALLGIPPKRPEQVRLTLTPSQLRWLWLLALGILPGLGLLAGAVVYYRRRR